MSCILWKRWLRGVSKAKARWPGSRGVGGGISAKYLLTALTVLLHLPTFVFGENIEPNLMKVWFKRIEKAGSICWMGFEVQALIFLHPASASNFLLAPSSPAANTETPQETQGPDRHTETSCGIFHTKTLPWTRLTQYKGGKGDKKLCIGSFLELLAPFSAPRINHCNASPLILLSEFHLTDAMEVESQTSCYYAQYVLIHIYTFLETEACIKICLWRQNWFWNIPRCGPWGLMACIVHIFLSPVRMTILSNARSLFWQLCDGVCGICQTSVGWGFMFNPKTGFLSRKRSSLTIFYSHPNVWDESRFSLH